MILLYHKFKELLTQSCISLLKLLFLINNTFNFEDIFLKHHVFVIKSSLIVKVVNKIYKDCKPYDNYQKDKRKKA